MYNGEFAKNISIVRLIVFVAIGLLSYSATEMTWISLDINLVDCTRCGELIVTIGNAFEKMLVNANFTVEEYLRVNAGIWSVSVCTVDRLCLDMTECEAEELFGPHPMFSRVFASLRLCAVFLKSGFLVTVLCFISACTASPSRITTFWFALSAGVLLLCPTIVLSAAHATRNFAIFHTKVFIPWAALSSTLADLMLFICAFLILKTTRATKSSVSDYIPWKCRKSRAVNVSVTDNSLWEHWRHRNKLLTI